MRRRPPGAACPGVFFGLNLAVFFAGATQQQRRQRGADRFALTVPHRADRRHALQGVHRPAGAGVRAVAFGGVVLVLFSAPPTGDASLKGNVFGIVAMLLWSAYVVVDAAFRRDMDVATFMATVSPIAAVAVLPLAIANGDVFGMSAHGLDLHAPPHVPHRGRGARPDGVRAEDDRDRHDRDLPGRATRARGRVVVPAAGRDGATRPGRRHRHRASAACSRSWC